ncbi:ABC transporter substrate-binding protein [Eggerthella sinensis]|uniref:ABC transporter substrate-binding protein n=1 Tax=Eggerthella sinensis TaxID=242230 RepID=UPI0022E3B160|nr:ABC transporter substrate-binding protein [Eggerthella sinensis]
MEHPTAPPAPTRTLSRRAFLALGGCAFVTALTGCSANKNVVVEVSDVEQAGVQLTFFGNKYEPLNVNAIEAILRSYMDEHPDVSIVYESIKGSTYYDALAKRLNTDHGDDVFVVDHDTVLAFAGTGCLAPLDSLSTIDSFSALALGQMRSEGAIYYVPTSVSAFGLYCNTDLLEAHRVEVPDSFPALLDACATFQSAGIAPLVANNDISLKTLALARGLADTYARDDAEERIAALTETRTRSPLSCARASTPSKSSSRAASSMRSRRSSPRRPPTTSSCSRRARTRSCSRAPGRPRACTTWRPTSRSRCTPCPRSTTAHPSW